MRRKNSAIKKCDWDGLLLIEKWQSAQYGVLANPKRNTKFNEAAALINELSEALLLERPLKEIEESGSWPTALSAAQHSALSAMRHKRAWNRMSKAFSEAVNTGDGKVFATMAAVIEMSKQPNDPAQAFIGRELQMCWQLRRPPPTIQKMVNALIAANIPTNYNSVKRYFEYFGIKPSPGAKGRPKQAAN